MARTTEGSEVIYCHGVEDIRIYKAGNGDMAISPYLVIEVGMDKDDDGTEYIGSVHAMLKNKLKIPFFVTSKLANVYVTIGM